MKRIEFYTFNDEVWYRTDTEHAKLTEKSPIVERMLEEVSVLYPKAYTALDKEYQRLTDIQERHYRMALRFVKCNFGEIDNVLDIQSNGKWVFECVKCPLRGECRWEGVICQPEFDSELSKREKEILKHVYDGLSIQDIAEAMYLSPHTVKNHIRNAYARLDIHSTQEFMAYAQNNGMYGDERR
ncbi:MAG: helix-turn-helix transcriptional regulator [Paludibacteraceae bacterium]|nr:helix-turn-helix transcriptional regulator [Paludibacteraceae bacterium]